MAIKKPEISNLSETLSDETTIVKKRTKAVAKKTTTEDIATILETKKSPKVKAPAKKAKIAETVQSEEIVSKPKVKKTAEKEVKIQAISNEEVKSASSKRKLDESNADEAPKAKKVKIEKPVEVQVTANEEEKPVAKKRKIEEASTEELPKTKKAKTEKDEGQKFSELDIPESLLSRLAAIEYVNMTPIQAEAIPVAMLGHDILGSAQTGTGKTAAFSIPLIAKLLASKDMGALILAPTRELATQINNFIRKLSAKGDNLRSALLIGGERMGPQIMALKSNPRIVVGTPGRVIDHLNRGNLNLANTEFLVLDEIDRMLEMNFGLQLDEIITFLKKKRQTMMFSATISKMMEKVAAKYLVDPKRITVGATDKPVAKIKQEFIHTTQAEKFDKLIIELETREGSIIIFVKTKMGTEELSNKMRRSGHESIVIHGDLRQNKRDQAIKNFREGKYLVIVATDVIARGLDVPLVQHVINYDLPDQPEDYVHRIGRTGRAGTEGNALSIIAPSDNKKWNDINRLINPTSKEFLKEDGSQRRGGFSGRSANNNNRRSFGNKPFEGNRSGGNRSFSDTRRPYEGGGNRSGAGAGRYPDSRPAGDRNFSDTRRPYEGGGNRSGAGAGRYPDSRPAGDRNFSDTRRPYEGGGNRSGAGAGRYPDSRPADRNFSDTRRPYEGGGNRPGAGANRYSDNKPYEGNRSAGANRYSDNKPYEGNRSAGANRYSDNKPYEGGNKSKDRFPSDGESNFKKTRTLKLNNN